VRRDVAQRLACRQRGEIDGGGVEPDDAARPPVAGVDHAVRQVLDASEVDRVISDGAEAIR
jgi:hypothetical protein